MSAAPDASSVETVGWVGDAAAGFVRLIDQTRLPTEFVRIDCRDVKSDYNSKRRAAAALDNLLTSLAVPWLIVSFNNEGYHDPAHVYERLAAHGYVNFVEVDFKRYVGAQIGIFNPSGEKVGAISHLRNKEVLFVVGPNREIVDNVFHDRDGTPDAVATVSGQTSLF